MSIEFTDVSFRYAADDATDSISRLTLSIPTGQLVVLTGASGSGKSTVTRLINGLAPHFYPGTLGGRVAVDGIDPSTAELYDAARVVGSVFQNPRTQFFTVDALSELAFGAENFGMAPDLIRARVAETIDRFGLSELLDRSIFHLSGGQKQLLACACVDITEPSVIVLDEPSANLDDAAIGELTSAIGRWKARGATVIVAEHRLGYLTELADRVVILSDGKVTDDLTADAFRGLTEADDAARALRSLHPTPIADLPLGRLGDDTHAPGTLPLVGVLRRFAAHTALDIREGSLPLGEVVAITGPNGSGKTTLARVLIGLDRHAAGTVGSTPARQGASARVRESYLVMQDVNHQLFTDTVLDEVLLSMPEPDEARAHEILASLGLVAHSGAHPLALSGGQRQRVAVASAIASQKHIVVLDEPTSGLDVTHMREVAALLGELREQGRSVFVVTHDPELIELACTWRVELDRGQLRP